MPSYERVAQIHQLLISSREPIALHQLCDRLNASPATIKRLISFLRHDLEMPVEFDHEHGGYRLTVDSRTARPMIGPLYEPEELSTLFTACLLAEKLLPNLFECTSAAIKEKFRQTLGNKAKKIDDLVHRFSVIAPQKRRMNASDFSDLVVALTDQVRITIYYRGQGRHGEASYTVSPYRLIFYRYNWYLAAWCHRDHALTILSADRIRVTERSTTPCRPISVEELTRLIESTYGIGLGEPTERAVLRFSTAAAKRVALEEWHRDQTLEYHADGGIDLSVPYRHSRDLKMDILRFGSDVEVIAPVSLRQEVAQSLAHAAARYT